jgi:hypothetical protein
MAGFWIIPLFTLNARIKVNHVDIGEDRLFKNLSLSSFGGATIRNFWYSGEYPSAYDKTAVMLYGGTSLGTRKRIDKFSYFEIFTNPHFSFTYYTNLGGRFDPKNILLSDYSYDKTYGTFGMWIPEFIVPIGVGLKYRNFIVKTGVTVLTTIGGEAINLNRNEALTDKIVVDSQNFSFFLNTGIHFRKFRQIEKR